MNNRHFYNFPRIAVAVYFMYCESIIMYRRTLIRAGCLSEKAYNRSSEPLLLANGCVDAILTYRVYQLYDSLWIHSSTQYISTFSYVHVHCMHSVWS